MKILFEIERETKGAVRYQEVPAEDAEPGIGTLYIRKWFLRQTFNGFPQALVIDIAKAEKEVDK